MEERKHIAIRALYAINSILDREGMTQSSLAKQLECKPAKFTEILKGRMLVPTEMMSILCEKFGVSADYLLTGAGDVRADKIEMGASTRLIPLLPFSAAAGYLAGGNDADAFRDEAVAFSDFTDRGADCAIRVDGDSMYPRYKSGDVLAIKILKDPKFFQWGRTYCISTTQGCIIKKLFPDPTDENKIICHSENTSAYPDYKITMDDVLAVAIVVGHAGVE